jgi:hypothetical protein
MPHELRLRASAFKVISERPVILTSKCRALGEGAITTYLKRFRFDAAGVEATKDSHRIMTAISRIILDNFVERRLWGHYFGCHSCKIIIPVEK